MPSDHELDQELRRTAQRSMDRRSAAVDVDAALSDHRFRRTTVPLPRRRDPRWLAAAAVAFIAAAGAVVIAWPSADPDLDSIVTDTAVTPSSSAASVIETPPTLQAVPTTIEIATSAQVTPSRVRPGGTIEITPGGAVERSCLDIVTVLDRDAGPARVAGQIVRGDWVAAPSDGSPVTYPACQGKTSADPVSVTLPTDIPIGDFDVCLGAPSDRTGCVGITIEPAPTGETICATEPLTPPSLVDGSSAGEPAIEERDDVVLVRWGAVDSPFVVTQALRSTFDASWLERALTDERAIVAGDWAATTVSVGDPPLGGITIYLRDNATGCDRSYSVGPGLYSDQAESLAASWVAALSTGAPIDPVGHGDFGANYFARRITPYDEPFFAIDELSATGGIISTVNRGEIAALLELGPLSDGSTVRLDGNPPQERCTNLPLLRATPTSGASDPSELTAARSIAVTSDGTLLATRDVCPTGATWGSSEAFSELVAFDPSAQNPSVISLRTWPSDPDRIVSRDGNRIIALGELSLGDASPTGRYLTLREQATSDMSRWVVLDIGNGASGLSVASSCPSDIAGPPRFVTDDVVVVARRCTSPDTTDVSSSDVWIEAVDLSAGNVLWGRSVSDLRVNDFRRAVGLSARQDDDGTIWALVAGNGGQDESSRTFAVSRDEIVEITRPGLQTFAFDPADLITEFDSPPG